ncbi:hypothetical protein TNCV_1073911 [Trichonephila clavipes]|uniref:Uncharacterized protein n=1 Tax=Trichonephila clavipes TaxID=2585209 RepID=A0A8X6SSW4_TRICX|nr:hypothetical protein TNCV_1073911 [Trichonephila clavipes]
MGMTNEHRSLGRKPRLVCEQFYNSSLQRTKSQMMRVPKRIQGFRETIVELKKLKTDANSPLLSELLPPLIRKYRPLRTRTGVSYNDASTSFSKSVHIQLGGG